MLPDTPFTPPKKKLRIWWWIGGFVFFLFVLFLYQLVGPSPRIVVSKETTYITEPLLENGLPDYRSFIRGKIRAGVTPDNNSAVLLWRALSFDELKPEHRKAIANEIGLDDVPSSQDAMQPAVADAIRERVMNWLSKSWPADPEVDEEALFDAIIGSAYKSAWTSEQLPPLAEWLAANKEPLDLIVEASRRPRYYFPSPHLVCDDSEMLVSMSMPSVQAIRDGAKGLAIRAAWHAGERRLEDAWRDNMAVYRLSNLISQGPTLIDLLVAVAIRKTAQETTCVILTSEKLTKELAREIMSDLAAVQPFKNAATCVGEYERIYGLDAVLHIAKDGVGTIPTLSGGEELNYLNHIAVNWNAVLLSMNRGYDKIVAAMQIQDSATRRTALNQVDIDLNAISGDVKQPGRLAGAVFSRGTRSELLGSVMRALLLPAITAVNTAEVRSNGDLALTQLAAALAVYRAEHGSYPEKLDDLVPGILPKLPVDLYHTKPFVYKRIDQGYLLYTLGENGTDDGGSNEQMRTFEGLELNGDDPAADDALRAKIPSGADDVTIRLPIPPFKLPKPPAPDSATAQ